MLDKAFTATPAPDQRDAHWAARVRSQTTNPEWESEGKTEGFIVDEDSDNWFLRSGTDYRTELTGRINKYLEVLADTEKIDLGVKGTFLWRHNRSKLLESKTHVETKVAAWMRQSDRKEMDVVINRDYICGMNFAPHRPGSSSKDKPGCYQAAAAILWEDQLIRVWLTGYSQPIIVKGTCRRETKQ